MAEVEKVAGEFNRRIPTPKLNQVLIEAVKKHPPAMFQGQRLKFFYAAQTAVRPPTFVIFVNKAEGIHFSYERFLTNIFREAFGFSGVPLRLTFRGRER
jgi:GTP-binding protein